MSTIVKVSAVSVDAGHRLLVVSERIVEDGRERHQNGIDEVAAGTEQDFIVHRGQSLRVAVEPVPAVADVATPEAAPAATEQVPA